MSKDRTSSRAGGEEPWYAEGLHFGCTRCNKCCGGAPGYVWVTAGEIERIAGFLGQDVSEFKHRHCRSVWWRTSLKELANGDCILLTPHGCSVYPVRPIQCKTFPFWKDNLRGIRQWETAGLRCPGVGNGRRYTREEIERILANGLPT